MSFAAARGVTSAASVLSHMRRPGLGVSGAVRRGSKNLDWYFAALEARKEATELDAAKKAQPDTPYPETPLQGRKRARAFLDVALEPHASAATARIIVELADDIVPLACRNFMELCQRKQHGYVGSEFFYVRKGHAVMAGDVLGTGNARGGHSAFASRTFIDENFIVRHVVPGMLTYANAGVHSNTSIFAITLAPAPQLDGRSVGFGRVLEGMDVLTRISSAFAVNFKPASPITIAAAGPLTDTDSAALDARLAAEAAKAKSAAAKATGDAAGKATPKGAPKAAPAAKPPPSGKPAAPPA